MKNASIILNSVLAVAVIALYILHFSSKPAPTQSGESGEAIVAGQGSVVYIQIDSLMNQYDMFNDLKSELESKAQVIQDDLSKRGRAFERDYKDWEEKIQKGLITRGQAEAQQQQLAARQQELQSLGQQKQMEMAEEENVLFNKVMNALTTYLKKYNEEKRFSVIINSSAAMNTVLEADSALNITKEVVTGLNEEYVKIKSKGK
ncbi:MAG: OmpH family outer membrane protein [Bacteroidales bacterium]|jgi:outer membrane protein|nr:OmpH family outer membrane protein [Bacteroidales bacterium]MDD3272501.1 OmpH family outer membrane protein [Bacteroidales bacterium]MDD4057835.1 OmpH family outer membrane protein [Bacteroidales bacterium]